MQEKNYGTAIGIFTSVTQSLSDRRRPLQNIVPAATPAQHHFLLLSSTLLIVLSLATVFVSFR
jgi:hypothetical protein